MSLVDEPVFRFPKTSRLVCATEYQSVIACNCRRKDTLFVVYARDNGGQPGRLGITVSRRTASKAVERNRIKRAIRESFRHKQRFLAGLDIVTIARRTTQQAETRQLFESLDNHWRWADRRCRHVSQ